MTARILIIEDEALIRAATAERLRDHGYDVVEAKDGAEGVELLTQDAFDLIICDFLLPALHGFRLVDKIQDRWPNTRILVMSGYLSPTTGKLIVRRGIEFIAKPFDDQALLSAVRRLLEPEVR